MPEDEQAEDLPAEDEFVPNADCALVTPSQVIIPEKLVYYIGFNDGKSSGTFQLKLIGSNDNLCPYTISTTIIDSSQPVLEVVPIVDYELYRLDLTQTSYDRYELLINLTVTSDDYPDLTWNYEIPVENVIDFVTESMKCAEC